MTRLLLMLAILSFIPDTGAIAADDEEGWFGIDVKVEGEGRFWNPVISAIIINSLETGSPAAASRIAVGDRIIEVDGVSVAGKRLRSLIPHFEKGVNETLHIVLIGPEDKQYSVSLVGARRPEAKDD